MNILGTQEEAAEAYDIAAIKFRGANAVTNFDMNRYDIQKICSSSTSTPNNINNLQSPLMIRSSSSASASASASKPLLNHNNSKLDYYTNYHRSIQSSAPNSSNSSSNTTMTANAIDIHPILHTTPSPLMIMNDHHHHHRHSHTHNPNESSLNLNTILSSHVSYPKDDHHMNSATHLENTSMALVSLDHSNIHHHNAFMNPIYNHAHVNVMNSGNNNSSNSTSSSTRGHDSSIHQWQLQLNMGQYLPHHGINSSSNHPPNIMSQHDHNNNAMNTYHYHDQLQQQYNHHYTPLQLLMWSKMDQLERDRFRLNINPNGLLDCKDNYSNNNANNVDHDIPGDNINKNSNDINMMHHPYLSYGRASSSSSACDEVWEETP